MRIRWLRDLKFGTRFLPIDWYPTTGYLDGKIMTATLQGILMELSKSRLFLLGFIMFIFCTWIMLVAAHAQDETETEEVVIRDPNYVNAVYGFGMALPDGYIAADMEDEDMWYLNILGDFDQPSAMLTIEELPEDISDVAGFWQMVKDRDQLMENNITYEMVSAVGNSGAILTRVEMIESGTYMLTLTWVFVHDDHGFMLSAYPPPGGENDTVKDFAKDLVDQFRWMSEEECAEFETEEEFIIPEGQEF